MYSVLDYVLVTTSNYVQFSVLEYDNEDTVLYVGETSNVRTLFIYGFLRKRPSSNQYNNINIIMKETTFKIMR